MRVLGIDPGISGAIALVKDNGRNKKMTCEFIGFLPSIERPSKSRSARKKKMLDGHALTNVIEYLRPDRAFVESVWALPPKRYYDPRLRQMVTEQGMGAVSAFNFGESFGLIQGVLFAQRIEFELVSPNAWKKAHGLRGEDKDKARPLAASLFPECTLSRKKDLPCAEAMLIARCGIFIARADPHSPEVRKLFNDEEQSDLFEGRRNA